MGDGEINQWCGPCWQKYGRAPNVNGIALTLELLRESMDRLAQGDVAVRAADALPTPDRNRRMTEALNAHAPLCCWMGPEAMAALAAECTHAALKGTPHGK